jgi:hypothetical protein
MGLFNKTDPAVRKQLAIEGRLKPSASASVTLSNVARGPRPLPPRIATRHASWKRGRSPRSSRPHQTRGRGSRKLRL